VSSPPGHRNGAWAPYAAFGPAAAVCRFFWLTWATYLRTCLKVKVTPRDRAVCVARRSLTLPTGANYV